MQFEANNVKRLIYVAGSFSPAPGSPSAINLKIRRQIFGTLWGLQGMLNDNDKVIDFLSRSKIDFIVARPSVLQEYVKTKEGEKKVVQVVAAAPKFNEPISYADNAKWVVDALTCAELKNRFPLLGYGDGSTLVSQAGL